MTTKTKAPKTVAKSLTGVLAHPLMAKIVDRTIPVEPIIDEVLGWWAYDLTTRKPGPAYWDAQGNFVPTDLDLACFLSALVDRNAVINLPTYTAMRGKSEAKKGERVISKNNRHGNVTALVANKEAFSFSVRVNDMNVVTQDENGSETVGAPRNFSLLGVDGVWHEGWKRIEFSPTAKENDFLNDRSLWTGNTVFFSNFVHPNRWSAFYGQNYFVTKALIDRLDDQAKFLFEQIKAYEGTESVATKAPSGGGKREEREKPETSKPIKVDAFEAEVHFGEFQGSYRSIPFNHLGRDAAVELRNKLIFVVIPRLRFYTRTVELAFFKHGFGNIVGECVERSERFPAWIKNASWERDWTHQDRPKTKLNRLVLAQPGVGQMGLSIAYRIYSKTERVAL